MKLEVSIQVSYLTMNSRNKKQKQGYYWFRLDIKKIPRNCAGERKRNEKKKQSKTKRQCK